MSVFKCLHCMYTFLTLHMVLKMFQAYLCDFGWAQVDAKYGPFALQSIAPIFPLLTHSQLCRLGPHNEE